MSSDSWKKNEMEVKVDKRRWDTTTNCCVCFMYCQNLFLFQISASCAVPSASLPGHIISQDDIFFRKWQKTIWVRVQQVIVIEEGRQTLLPQNSCPVSTSWVRRRIQTSWRTKKNRKKPKKNGWRKTTDDDSSYYETLEFENLHTFNFCPLSLAWLLFRVKMVYLRYKPTLSENVRPGSQNKNKRLKAYGSRN